MKPGTIRTDGSPVVFDQSTQVGEVDQVHPTKARVDVDQLPDAGRSQLPPVDASRPDTAGESGLVRGRVDADADDGRPKGGRRQKFLKVPDAKTLPKQAKERFRDLAEVLGRATQTLRKRSDVAGDFGTEDA
jgi:hypothetical protein